MKMTKILLGLLIVLMVFAASGCEKGSQGEPAKPAAGVSDNAAKPAETSMEVKLYYPNNDATKLVGIKRTIRFKGSSSAKYRAVIDELLKGPEDSGLVAIIPKQTKLLGVSVAGDTAKVDFDKALVNSFNGGSTGEEMLVGSIVNTLTEFPEIKKVQIVVEGRNVETLKGHIDTSKPLPRMEELLK